MADLLKGRENDDVYGTFMKRFVQHSVGKRAWKAWLQEGSKGCPVTPTDEAFVLVVLENAWDVWINLFEQPVCVREAQIVYVAMYCRFKKIHCLLISPSIVLLPATLCAVHRTVSTRF